MFSLTTSIHQKKWTICCRQQNIKRSGPFAVGNKTFRAKLGNDITPLVK